MKVFWRMIRTKCWMQKQIFFVLPHQPPQPSLCPASLLSASRSQGVAQGWLWQSNGFRRRTSRSKSWIIKSIYKTMLWLIKYCKNSGCIVLWCWLWGGGAVGEGACRPPVGQSSCWGCTSPAPWPVFLSEWPVLWWGSGSEPWGFAHYWLVSRKK